MLRFIKETLKAIGYFLFYFGVQLLVSILIAFVLAAALGVFGGLSGVLSLPEMYTQLVRTNPCLIQFFANAYVLVLLWAFFAARKKSFADEIELKPIAFYKPMLLFLLGFCLNILVIVLISYLPIPENLLADYNESSAFLTVDPLPVRVLSIAIVAPLTEEVVFRGLIQTRLKRVMPNVVAALIQSLIFGLLHGSPIWIAYGFLMGLLLTFVSQKTHSLWASIALHIGFNCMGL